ncbi:Ankyrin repeat protein 1 [Giardia muris]|uniref:Ankyrin repeat protein 1 n=1 Tax=Giardia muris TaxID=5742 RepID=A0A4Z1SR18_GIAMU|nr:Ankyrin repeat protein 1 [Giardia muris]|eukprot:TNJ28334.1 Ankyrin repeat protein 1 [Giardia muris]
MSRKLQSLPAQRMYRVVVRFLLGIAHWNRDAEGVDRRVASRFNYRHPLLFSSPIPPPGLLLLKANTVKDGMFPLEHALETDNLLEVERLARHTIPSTFRINRMLHLLLGQPKYQNALRDLIDANLSRPVSYGWIQQALQNKNLPDDIAELIRSHMCPTTPMKPGAYAKQERRERTPLHNAVLANDLKLVHANLQYLGGRDINGDTALIYAARSAHVYCIEMLIGEVGLSNDKGETALMWAAFRGSTQCIKILAPHELKYVTDKDKMSALLWSLQHVSFTSTFLSYLIPEEDLKDAYGIDPTSLAKYLDLDKTLERARNSSS